MRKSNPYYRRGKTPYLAQYGTHRRTAPRRGILFELTFEQWLTIWTESGHLHERGIKKGQYVMARYNDVGPYAVGNVKIVLCTENLSEGNSRPKTKEHRDKIGKAHLGMKRSMEARANMSRAAYNRYQ